MALPAFSLAVFAVTALSSCAQARRLDALEASRAIQNFEGFKQPRTLAFDARVAASCPAALVMGEKWRQLQSLGVIEVREVRPWGGAAGVGCEAVLSEEARQEAERWSWADPPRPQSSLASAMTHSEPSEWRLPVAVRHLARITSIRLTERGGAEAEFMWQWQSNKLGERLGVEARMQTATATLWLYQEGWRAVRVNLGE